MEMKGDMRLRTVRALLWLDINVPIRKAAKEALVSKKMIPKVKNWICSLDLKKLTDEQLEDIEYALSPMEVMWKLQAIQALDRAQRQVRLAQSRTSRLRCQLNKLSEKKLALVKGVAELREICTDAFRNGTHAERKLAHQMIGKLNQLVPSPVASPNR